MSEWLIISNCTFAENLTFLYSTSRRPAHIYTNLGRYDDCIAASKLAISSDMAYKSSCFTPAYDIHNQDVLVECAVMGGHLKEALTYAVPAGTLMSEAMSMDNSITSITRPYHYTLALVSGLVD